MALVIGTTADDVIYAPSDAPFVPIGFNKIAEATNDADILDGDKVSDFPITLAGGIALVAGDFVL